MIQGFSGDSGTLAAAARALLRYQSLLLSPETQQQQEEILAATLIGPIDQAIRKALAAQDSFQKFERMNLTLNALDALAQAVTGYPGRKNLIWLSAEFPIAFGPDMTPYNAASHSINTGRPAETNNQMRDLSQETPAVRQTAALLAAARIAVYPIDVRGQISMGTGMDVSTQTASLGDVSSLQTEIGDAHSRQTTSLWDAHEAMSDIARETGGRAFYGTNDLKDAISRSVQQGSSYYTLAYAPNNHDWNGKYRKIEVKAAQAGTQLTYRRGYYALQERELGETRAAAAMTAAMRPSVPEFTGLLLKVQVLPPDADHTSVRIDYAVGAREINFTDSADQRKHGTLDCVTTAWDQDFKQVGRVAGSMETTLRLEAYHQVMRTGVPFHQELELKPGTYTLRLGVLDRGSHKLGTVQVPVTVPAKGNPTVSQKSQ